MHVRRGREKAYNRAVPARRLHEIAQAISSDAVAQPNAIRLWSRPKLVTKYSR